MDRPDVLLATCDVPLQEGRQEVALVFQAALAFGAEPDIDSLH